MSARSWIRSNCKFASTGYPLAGPEVSGLRVADDIPNTGSISSSLIDYEVLSGIREVPLSEFDISPYHAADDNNRVSRLAWEIKENGWVTPLIVVIDAEGAYILEGGHRLDALGALGIESLPALVVIDREQVPEDTAGPIDL